MQRIVLAYSGGLETTVAIPWLRAQHEAAIVAVTMDLGQGRELEEVRDRALAAGALRAHVLDVREEFARLFILPALEADAMDGDRSPLAASLGWALIAQKLIDIADIEQATAVAHGCGGDTPAEAPLEAALRAVRPTLAVLAPARVWERTRAETVEYARQSGVAVPADAALAYRADTNLWGRSITGGALDDAWAEPPEEIFALTKSPADCLGEPAYVEVAFERGVPVAINGVAMPFVELIGSLGTIAGAHGVGRIDRAVDRPGGLKARTIHEAPAAVVLHAAHAELQKLVTSRDLDRLCRLVSQQYADLVVRGHWFTPMRDALDAFVARVQEQVTGVVRLKLFKGDCRIVGRRSPFTLAGHAPAADDGAAIVGGVARRTAISTSLAFGKC